MRRVVGSSVVLGACLVVSLAGWLVLPVALAQAAPHPALLASPATAITGEAVTLRTRLGSRAARPVRVERSTGGRWTTVARTRSDRAGVVSSRQRATAARATYRVVAPAVVHRGRRLPAVVSAVARVTASPQTATAALSTAVGGVVSAAVTVSHVRPGRVVRLQLESGSGWSTLDSAEIGRTRSVRFPAVATATQTAGRRVRAVLAPYDGLPAVVTPVLAPPTAEVDAAADGRDVVVTARTTGAVERVRFFGDGVLIGEDASAPWSVTWSPRIGEHDVVARAVSPLGSTVSPVAMVTTAAVVADSGVAEGFELEEVQGGLELPTSAATLPSGGVLVTEKGGRVLVVEHGEDDGFAPARTVLDLSAEVHSEGDAGLIGLAVDPGFVDNGFVYVSFVRDDSADGVDRRSQQVARFTWDGERLDPASRHVVLGNVGGEACWAEDNVRTPDCVPLIGSAHTIGDLGFDDGGHLLVGVGDGSLYYTPDGVRGRLEALRVQDPEVLAGKVLRIDSETGRGVPGNPLHTGDGSSNASRVLAMGFRNPFRFTHHDGLLVVGDVGEGDVEEIDTLVFDEVIDRPGASVPNFGWPCLEGDGPTPLGVVDAPDSPWQACAAVRADDATLGPSYSYPHVNGGSVSGGVFLDSDAYPAAFRGRYVFGDYAQNHIRTAEVDHHGVVTGVAPFADATAAGGPVKFFTGPDGLVWSVSIMHGSLRRIRWTGDGLADRCPVGTFRRTFHDLDGPDSAFDEEIPPSPYAWLLPYAAIQLPVEAMAPASCVDGIQLSTTGSPWLADGEVDGRAHPGDRFGASWRGRIDVPEGTYRFTVSGSEWVRLWVDGEPVHNFWSNGWWSLEQRQHVVELGAGQHVVRAELVHGDQGLAAADVAWEQVGGPPEVSLDLPANGSVATDNLLSWSITATDPDGGAEPDVVLEVDFLHYTGDALHAHPSSRIVGQRSGSLQVSDEHAPGSGALRVRAVAVDETGSRSRSAPVYVCFAGGAVGPCGPDW
ncbi:PQQ-dependent sugar dehydrogenase [Nocardioides caeni]|uniref:Glucose/Sorbosone dehydrogenase domain-containing protein n=1 Tax=Nocardioides caeni TaxID=574700 RepID=A0A4S8NQ32_9ACTN|nr:PQQ-dependent sugar dehydrogenase [Nocardioides caeni]THV18605.1 hypothetical protein E9934_03070 [Nocardioides caeni]